MRIVRCTLTRAFTLELRTLTLVPLLGTLTAADSTAWLALSPLAPTQPPVPMPSLTLWQPWLACAHAPAAAVARRTVCCRLRLLRRWWPRHIRRASTFRTHVWSLASGLGHATRFDSSVGVPVLYLISAAIDVSSGVSNPRIIALTVSLPALMALRASLPATWRPLLLQIIIPVHPS